MPNVIPGQGGVGRVGEVKRFFDVDPESETPATLRLQLLRPGVELAPRRHANSMATPQPADRRDTNAFQ